MESFVIAGVQGGGGAPGGDDRPSQVEHHNDHSDLLRQAELAHGRQGEGEHQQ